VPVQLRRPILPLYRQLREQITRFFLRGGDVFSLEKLERWLANSDAHSFLGARIFVMSAFDGDVEIYRALQAGARGYLLKSNSPQELLDARCARRRVDPKWALGKARELSYTPAGNHMRLSGQS